MAPNFPQPYWALAKAYSNADKFNFLQTFQEYFKGSWVAVKNFKSFIRITTNWFFISYFALFLTLLTFVFIIMLKYFPLLSKDCEDFFSRRTYHLPGYLWASLILLPPVILGLGPILIASYFLLVLSIYFNKKEKYVACVFFVLFVFSPGILKTGSSLVEAQQGGLLDLLYRANYEDWSPETEKNLKQYLQNNPQDPYLMFSLGLIEKREGNLEEAKRYYQKLYELFPSSAAIVNNLANVYFAQGNLELAEATYKKAIELDNRHASFHYNLYRTYLELYKFLEARKKEELYIARKLAPELIDYQKTIYAPNIPNRIVIDETLTFLQFWKRLFQHSEQKDLLASSLWNYFFKGIPYRYGFFSFILVTIFFSFVFFYLDVGKNFSTRCGKCGKPMKQKGRMLRQKAGFSPICFQCLSIYLKESEDKFTSFSDNWIKEIKRKQNHQLLIRGILTHIMPGGAQIWLGFPMEGFIYVFIFYCFVLKIIFWNGIVKDPLFLNQPLFFYEFFTFSLLFFSFYFFAQRQSNQAKLFFEKNFIKLAEAFKNQKEAKIEKNILTDKGI